MNLYHAISSISAQTLIDGTKVIIADISDEKKSLDIIEQIKDVFNGKLDIEVIKGGYPAYGRYKGAELVKTKFVLFMDADIILMDRLVLYNTIHNTKHLTTVTFSTDPGFNWIYRIFEMVQRMMKLMGSSFAIGGYQLFRTDIYRTAGGYNPNHVFAEDYYISNKIDPKQFHIHKTDGVYTSARRFKNKGLFYMVSLMIKCYLNKDKEQFYLNSHGYWD